MFSKYSRNAKRITKTNILSKFQCFVEGCDKICLTRDKRRMHLVDKHSFPKVGKFRNIYIMLSASFSLMLDRIIISSWLTQVSIDVAPCYGHLTTNRYHDHMKIPLKDQTPPLVLTPSCHLIPRITIQPHWMLPSKTIPISRPNQGNLQTWPWRILPQKYLL